MESASAFSITVDGTPQCVILLDERPTMADLDAVEELNYWIGTITGSKLPVQKASEWDRKTPYIAIGESSITQENGWSTKELDFEDAKVIIEANRIGLLGSRTLPHGIRPWPNSFERGWAYQSGTLAKRSPGSSGPGTYYAALELIQKKLEVRWIWPGKTGEVYHSQKTLSLAPAQWTWKPFGSFKRTMTNSNGRADIYEKRFGKKVTPEQRKQLARVAEQSEQWRKRQRMHVPHAVTPMIFPDWWRKYHARHPDWFARPPAGRQPITRGLAKLNLSNPTLVDGVFADWRIAKKSNPDLKFYVDITPTDLKGFDTRPETRALDAPEMQKLTDEEIFISDKAILSDRYLYFTNRLAEKFQKESPGTKLITLAYCRYRKPPLKKDGVIVADNVVIGFVGGEGYYPDEPELLNEFQGWRERQAKMYWRPNIFHCGHGVPYLFPRQLHRDLSAMIAGGLIGVDYDTMTGHWGALGLNYYMAAELHNRPTASYDTLAGEYFQAFGKAAPFVQSYHELFERLVIENAPRLKDKKLVRNESWGQFWRGHMYLTAIAFTDEVFSEAGKLLTKAEEAVHDDLASRQRVAFLRKAFEQARLTASTFRAIGLNQPGEPLNLDMELLAPLWRLRQEGIGSHEFNAMRLLNHEQVQFNIWSDFIENPELVDKDLSKTPLSKGWKVNRKDRSGEETWTPIASLKDPVAKGSRFYKTEFHMPQLHDSKQYATLRFDSPTDDLTIRINGRRVPASYLRPLKGAPQGKPVFLINILDFVQQAETAQLEIETATPDLPPAEAVTLMTTSD